MNIKIKESRFFEEQDRKQFYKFLIDADLSIGIVADKLDVTYNYLHAVINGKRAFTKKLEEKFSKIGFKL